MQTSVNIYFVSLWLSSTLSLSLSRKISRCMANTTKADEKKTIELINELDYFCFIDEASGWDFN